MARLNIAIEHGQPPDLAAAKFQAAILDAQDRFGSWIDQVDWSEDRRSATLSGSGFEVRFWFDDRLVHAQGQIPLAWKLLEGPMRSYLKGVIDNIA
jgi:hypothetical protein